MSSLHIQLSQEVTKNEYDKMPAKSVVFVNIDKEHTNFLTFSDNSVRVFINENNIDPRLTKRKPVYVIDSVEEFKDVLNTQGEFFVRLSVAKSVCPEAFCDSNLVQVRPVGIEPTTNRLKADYSTN